MKKLLTLMLIFSATYLHPQIYKDTLNVATGQLFSVPANFSLLLNPVIKISLKAELFDYSSNNKIRDCDKPNQRPSNEVLKNKRGKRGTPVQLRLHETINKTGKYYIKISGEVKHEKGSSLFKRSYFINVKNPTLAAPINLQKEYYYSEKVTFSFAMNELEDINKYSWAIFTDVNERNTQIDAGQTPIINLDNILTDLRYLNKKIQIHGYYNNKIITCQIPQSDSLVPTVWEINILAPGIEYFHCWSEDKSKPAAINFTNNKLASRIGIGYFGEHDQGYAFVLPEFYNLKLEGKIESEVIKGNFLTTQKPDIESSALLKYIVLPYNLDQMKLLEECEVYLFTLNISFEDQFGIIRKKTFYAEYYK